MTELTTLLTKMADEIPGLIATAVIGMDGLEIARISQFSGFDIEIASAQFALIMKLVHKSVDRINDKLVESLLTLVDTCVLIKFLGDGNFFLCIAADLNKITLGSVRLIAQNYTERLEQVIPGVKVKNTKLPLKEKILNA